MTSKARRTGPSPAASSTIDRYLSLFAGIEEELAASGSWLHATRKAALGRFAELGFPTPREDAWKYTRVAPIADVPFRLPRLSTLVGQVDGLAKHAHHVLDDRFRIRLVFVNGRYAPGLSRSSALPKGLAVESLSVALNLRARPVLHIGRLASFQAHAFTALNTAFFREGGFVHLPAGAALDEPIHLVFVSVAEGEPTMSTPRILVIAEPGSRATVIEHHVGVGDGVTFTNAVTEIVAGEGSVVEHVKLQEQSPSSFHVGALHVEQARDSRFTSRSFSLGGALVRGETHVVLVGEGTHCVLDGLTLASDAQHMDQITTVDHAQPRGTSRQLYKSLLGGKAHGVFNGKIIVRPDAQKTDASQINKNLLLSEDAAADTRPQLEIFADDVKCAHGAAVGQLDRESLFYLRSRGIPEAEAKSLLAWAFAGEMVERISHEAIRDRVRERVMSRLKRDQIAGIAA